MENLSLSLYLLFTNEKESHTEKERAFNRERKRKSSFGSTRVRFACVIIRV